MNACDDPELTLHGGAAIHRQIQDQIRQHIATGRLRPGEQLPTVREVAVELAVNPNAVRQAYAELEHEGFLTSAEGSGTFVAWPLSARPAQRQAELEGLGIEFLTQAACRGFSAEELIHTIQALTQRRSPS